MSKSVEHGLAEQRKPEDEIEAHLVRIEKVLDHMPAEVWLATKDDFRIVRSSIAALRNRAEAAEQELKEARQGGMWDYGLTPEDDGTRP